MKSLFNIDDANALIATGKNLLIAGHERLLSKLRKGNWIGGTIPYFMGDAGGIVSSDVVQITVLPDEATESQICSYSTSNVHTLPNHYRSSGFSVIIIPAFSTIHRVFAENAPSWPGLFSRPLVGWVSGFHLNEGKNGIAKVYNGSTGEVSNSDAIVMHLSLPPDRFAKVNIINLFEQGVGDTITFPATGFQVSTATINGIDMNFSSYIEQNKVDTTLPLVADYFGAKINVSFRLVNTVAQTVDLSAPVYADVEYRIAKPIGDYETEFAKHIQDKHPNACFMCNCVFNFVYANLENKRTKDLVGPMTFGEIAYMLLNQTLVYMTIEDSKHPVVANT